MTEDDKIEKMTKTDTSVDWLYFSETGKQSRTQSKNQCQTDENSGKQTMLEKSKNKVER